MRGPMFFLQRAGLKSTLNHSFLFNALHHVLVVIFILKCTLEEVDVEVIDVKVV